MNDDTVAAASYLCPFIATVSLFLICRKFNANTFVEMYWREHTYSILKYVLFGWELSVWGGWHGMARTKRSG